jgi:uncharacterized protein (TIGR03086 family)
MSSPESDRYRRLAARFTELVRAVPTDAWPNRSPCADWTAIDVLHHVVTTQADLLDRMTFGSALDLGLGASYDSHVLIAAWDRVRDVVQTELDTPEHADLRYDGYFGPTTFAETIDRFYSFDLVVHCWDLARATGMRAYEEFDPSEIEKSRDDFADLSSTMRQPGLLGPELDVSVDADDATKFLAFLGRAA